MENTWYTKELKPYAQELRRNMTKEENNKYGCWLCETRQVEQAMGTAGGDTRTLSQEPDVKGGPIWRSIKVERELQLPKASLS